MPRPYHTEVMHETGLLGLVAAVIKSAIDDHDKQWLCAFGQTFIGALTKHEPATERYYALALQQAERRRAHPA